MFGTRPDLVHAEIRFKTCNADDIDIVPIRTCWTLDFPAARLFGQVKAPKGMQFIKSVYLQTCKSVSGVLTHANTFRKDREMIVMARW